MKKNNKYQAADKLSPLIAKYVVRNIMPDKINEITQIKIADILKDAYDFTYKKEQKANQMRITYYIDYDSLLGAKEYEIYKKYSMIYWSEENKRIYTCIHDVMKSSRAAIRLRFQLNELDKKCSIQEIGGKISKSLYSAILNKLMLYETNYYLIEYKYFNETLYKQYAKLFNLLMEDYVRISEYLYNRINVIPLQHQVWRTFYGYYYITTSFKSDVEVYSNCINVTDPNFAFHFLYTYYKKCRFDGPKISADYMQAVCVKIDDDKNLEEFYNLENKLYAKKLIYKIYTKQSEYNIELNLKDTLANFKMNPDNLSIVLDNYEKYKSDEKLYQKFISAMIEYIDNEVSFNKKRDTIGKIYSEISERTDVDTINDINNNLSSKARYYLLKYMCRH